LLDRLDGVRQVAPGRWRARCPAHDGTNRDVLSIGETNDDVVLVKCFHGCTAEEVVRAVGLELADLFPRLESGRHAGVGRHLRKYDADEDNHPHLLPVRRPRVDWVALIGACERDMLLVKIVLSMLARGEPVHEGDARACDTASTRVYTLIQEARHG
jgi:hypothetical protein